MSFWPTARMRYLAGYWSRTSTVRGMAPIWSSCSTRSQMRACSAGPLASSCAVPSPWDPMPLPPQMRGWREGWARQACNLHIHRCRQHTRRWMLFPATTHTLHDTTHTQTGIGVMQQPAGGTLQAWVCNDLAKRGQRQGHWWVQHEDIETGSYLGDVSCDGHRGAARASNSACASHITRPRAGTSPDAWVADQEPAG